MSNQVVGLITRISVPSVNPSTPVIQIASLMTQQNIGAVIVTKDYDVLGIVTEKDIIEWVALGERDIAGLAAQDIMTAPVITINHDRTVADALKIMQDNNIRRLVVVRGKRVLGLVTQRRLLLASLTTQNPSKA